MLDLNAICLLFVLLGVFIFVFGLFANNIIRESHLPSVVLELLRYGRASVPSKEKSVILRWIEVPKSWFAHFYLYCTLIQSYIFCNLVTFYIFGWSPHESFCYKWLSSILNVVAHSSQTSPGISPMVGLLASFLFLFQVSRRLYENCYVSVFSDTKMNVIHYLIGFLHYTGSTLSLLSASPPFAGKFTDAHSNQINWGWNEMKKEIGVLQWAGIALFLYGSIQQYRAHVTFANLRKKGEKVFTQRHQIPRGGLFELISCPNYWAEILIYGAFALMFAFKNNCWNAILFWVVANQVTAGVMNHIWYKEKFPEYPKNRKAVIPYVW